LNHVEILDKIFELRKKHKINQKKFAKLVGAQSNTVSRWDRKKNVPLPIFLRKMEEMLRFWPKRKEEKTTSGRLDAMLKFMQKQREERNSGTGEKDK
jgi:transcriptional regulator with XRE-family HTH domain